MAESEIDMECSEAELYDFQWEHVRTLWKPTGMRCSIPDCEDTIFYTVLRDYFKHWHVCHKRTVNLFECMVCHKKLSKKKKARRHLKTWHSNKGEFRQIEVPNRTFIDPGDIVPPRPGTPAERREAMNQARKEAQEARKAAAQRVVAGLSEPSSSASICRDEEVLYHRNGPSTKRVKTNWNGGVRAPQQEFNPEDDVIIPEIN